MTAIGALLNHAPEGAQAVLEALAIAESLTDQTAELIYAVVPLEGVSYADFLSALRFSNIIEPRNSEWSFVPQARRELRGGARLSGQDRQTIHRVLLDEARTGDPMRAGWDTPSYLFTYAGIAYHQAALGELDEALRLYSEAAMGHYSGAQWLAAELAAEQERAGLLPPNAIETTFLRAMVLFRTGRKQAALTLLRKVAAAEEHRIEVAIALHIVANEQARRRETGAEASYNRSIEIREQIGDQSGIAQTSHSLANMYTRQQRYFEAESAYQRSVEILEQIGDDAGVAQTSHSLANMYTRQEHYDEAERAYNRSIEISEKVGRLGSLAQTLHSLANMYTDQGRYDEAENAYKHSITIDENIGNTPGVAQTEHSLANMYARQQRYDEAERTYKRIIEISERNGSYGTLAQALHSLANMYVRQQRYDEAESAYKRSITIDESLGNRFGIAQAEHSLANMYVRQHRYDDAEARYRRSVAIGEEIQNQNHVAQTLRSYAALLERRSPQAALELLERSLQINKNTGNRNGVRIVERSLKELRRRHRL